MIYTVTFNPSLDYAMEMDEIETGALNRAKSTQVTAGGKGINVSKVLANLNVENLILKRRRMCIGVYQAFERPVADKC